MKSEVLVDVDKEFNEQTGKWTLTIYVRRIYLPDGDEGAPEDEILLAGSTISIEEPAIQHLDWS